MTSAIYAAHQSGQVWKTQRGHRSNSRRIVDVRVSQGGGRYIFYIARDSGRILDVQMVEPEAWDFPIEPERLRLIRELASRQ